MYCVRKQISLNRGVGQFGDEAQKIYLGHISENREHDRSYIAASIDDALSVLSVSDSLFLRSDNASNFKSAEAFHDMQSPANKWNINIVRIYGTAWHGKGEVDSAGGHMKNPVRKHISKGNNVRSASAVEEFLMDKEQREVCKPCISREGNPRG